jgi:hypothetical protein
VYLIITTAVRHQSVRLVLQEAPFPLVGLVCIVVPRDGIVHLGRQRQPCVAPFRALPVLLLPGLLLRWHRAGVLARDGALLVADEPGHDHHQPCHVVRSHVGGLWHEGQGEGEVTQGHHDRHGQPEDVRVAELEDHDDEDVVAHVEDQVDVDEQRRLRIAIVGVRFVVVAVGFGAGDPHVAAQAVPEVAGQLGRVQGGAARECGGDGERNRKEELEHGDPERMRFEESVG